MAENENEHKEMMAAVEEMAGFQVEPDQYDVSGQRGFTRVALSGSFEWQVSNMMQQIPSFLAAGDLAQAYVVRFPEGLPHTLTRLKQGGFSSMIKGEDGKFLGTASFYSMNAQAVFYQAFNVMSVITSQHYLAEINEQMKVMNYTLDRILAFLYGDKKSELLAEVSFVKYACENFNSIMLHAEQRTATIASLQGSKKVAMKDIEFYISDLESVVNGKDSSDVEATAQKAFQIKDSLELSMQLYGMSSVLEVYYSENYDKSYMSYIDQEISTYLVKCEKRMLGAFSMLKTMAAGPKKSLGKGKIDGKLIGQIGRIVDSLANGEESELRKSLSAVLNEANEAKEYYLTKDGRVYLRTAA